MVRSRAVGALAFVFTVLAGVGTAEYDVLCIGSSYVVPHDYIKSMADSAGMDLNTSRSQIIGAPLRWIHDHCSEANPTDPCVELPTGTVELLSMNAQRPFFYTEEESFHATCFADLLLTPNPDARVMIQDYWCTDGNTLYPQAHGWDNVNAMRLGSIKVVRIMVDSLGHKVYTAPVGTALQLLAEMSQAGEFTGISGDHPGLSDDGSHLSSLGHYVQACLTFCGGYRYDVRNLPGRIVGSWGQDVFQMDPADAVLVHELVYTTVRTTPFSGWYENEPASVGDYRDSLGVALMNWESFDRIHPFDGDGTVTGDNGVEWTVVGLNTNKNGYTIADAFAGLDNGGSMSTTLPHGIRDLHIAVKNVASLVVEVDGLEVATVTGVQDGGWSGVQYFKVADIGKHESCVLTIRAVDTWAILDNVSWTLYDDAGQVTTAPVARPAQVRHGLGTASARFSLDGRALGVAAVRSHRGATVDVSGVLHVGPGAPGR